MRKRESRCVKKEELTADGKLTIENFMKTCADFSPGTSFTFVSVNRD